MQRHCIMCRACRSLPALLLQSVLLDHRDCLLHRATLRKLTATACQRYENVQHWKDQEQQPVHKHIASSSELGAHPRMQQTSTGKVAFIASTCWSNCSLKTINSSDSDYTASQVTHPFAVSIPYLLCSVLCCVLVSSVIAVPQPLLASTPSMMLTWV